MQCKHNNWKTETRADAKESIVHVIAAVADIAVLARSAYR
jgi:hypothetical protein